MSVTSIPFSSQYSLSAMNWCVFCNSSASSFAMNVGVRKYMCAKDNLAIRLLYWILPLLHCINLLTAFWTFLLVWRNSWPCGVDMNVVIHDSSVVYDKILSRISEGYKSSRVL